MGNDRECHSGAPPGCNPRVNLEPMNSKRDKLSEKPLASMRMA
jgi:hypothetical protein